ncbi:hypothetical protein AAFC00_002631 [Neodothiora populina]|uniref:Uncharacterized protein n=1 Tax=Neodothiora populina TaxID=2781224 RepID=A0ABR3P7P4_9PEZI
MAADPVLADSTAVAAASEETPLLQADPEVLRSDAESQNHSSLVEDEDEDDKPLPKRQIFLLCYCRAVEPLAFFSIFPFINQMIQSIGVREEDVGFYSGLIGSLFH